ncbi:MAG: DUF3422 domain-containing protein [Caulobacterales bacterium]|nr:DUF3422 domain-containing protein [Caulobacterales bacterium]MCA0373311.1 DUF3422 domain-containing protein [Pseudomonadota bacterium]
MQNHPLRTILTDLFHERALPVLKAPLILRCWLVMVDDDERGIELANLREIAPEAQKGKDGGLFQIINEKNGLIFERHGEFSTYLMYQCFETDEQDGIIDAFDNLKNPWIENAPGNLFRTIEIDVYNEDIAPEIFEKTMNLQQAVSCKVFHKRARLWTDFRATHKGAGRVIIQDFGLKNDELSRLLQSVIEIGNYRKLALLGFLPAREQLGAIKKYEIQLGEITKQLIDPQVSEIEIQRELAQISAEIEKRIHDTRFRFGATEAYYRITKDRLETINESAVFGYSTMREFIERRLTPAMRTVEAASKRLDDISARIGRVNDLLRTKISTTIETQNQDLLHAMNERQKIQMKLSELVEGLSVFAISYYIWSLAKYIIESIFGEHSEQIHKFYGFIIIGILICAYILIHGVKRKISKGKNNK